nr:MAG: putative coat protein [Leviviridae sp.]
MLGDTLVVTINAVAKTLNRINQDGYASEYFLREATQDFRMKVRHTKDRPTSAGVAVDRHNVELTQTIYPVAPATVNKIRRVYGVITNENSDDSVQIGYLQAGLSGFLTAANVTKLANWES